MPHLGDNIYYIFLKKWKSTVTFLSRVTNQNYLNYFCKEYGQIRALVGLSSLEKGRKQNKNKIKV